MTPRSTRSLGCSNPIVVSVTVGPNCKRFLILTDPHRQSQCREVANTDFSKIERSDRLDRLKWLQRTPCSIGILKNLEMALLATYEGVYMKTIKTKTKIKVCNKKLKEQ